MINEVGTKFKAFSRAKQKAEGKTNDSDYATIKEGRDIIEDQ